MQSLLFFSYCNCHIKEPSRYPSALLRYPKENDMTLNLLNARINCHIKFSDDRLIVISFFSAQTVDISTGLGLPN